jgi:hypothetical protein
MKMYQKDINTSLENGLEENYGGSLPENVININRNHPGIDNHDNSEKSPSKNKLTEEDQIRLEEYVKAKDHVLAEVTLGTEKGKLRAGYLNNIFGNYSLRDSSNEKITAQHYPCDPITVRRVQYIPESELMNYSGKTVLAKLMTKVNGEETLIYREGVLVENCLFFRAQEGYSLLSGSPRKKGRITNNFIEKENLNSILKYVDEKVNGKLVSPSSKNELTKKPKVQLELAQIQEIRSKSPKKGKSPDKRMKIRKELPEKIKEFKKSLPENSKKYGDNPPTGIKAEILKQKISVIQPPQTDIQIENEEKSNQPKARYTIKGKLHEEILRPINSEEEVETPIDIEKLINGSRLSISDFDKAVEEFNKIKKPVSQEEIVVEPAEKEKTIIRDEFQEEKKSAGKEPERNQEEENAQKKHQEMLELLDYFADRSKNKNDSSVKEFFAFFLGRKHTGDRTSKPAMQKCVDMQEAKIMMLALEGLNDEQIFTALHAQEMVGLEKKHRQEILIEKLAEFSRVVEQIDDDFDFLISRVREAKINWHGYSQKELLDHRDKVLSKLAMIKELDGEIDHWGLEKLGLNTNEKSQALSAVSAPVLEQIFDESTSSDQAKILTSDLGKAIGSYAIDDNLQHVKDLQPKPPKTILNSMTDGLNSIKKSWQNLWTGKKSQPAKEDVPTAQYDANPASTELLNSEFGTSAVAAEEKIEETKKEEEKKVVESPINASAIQKPAKKGIWSWFRGK